MKCVKENFKKYFKIIFKKYFYIICYILLSLFIYFNYDLSNNKISSIEMKITVEKMFILSVGLSTIIIFITNTLEKKNEDVYNEEKFYLGYNMKNIYYMKKFWIRQYINFPVKSTFWTNIIMLTIVFCLELEYRINWLKDVFSYVKTYENIFILGWLFSFIVSSLYFIGIFIESVDITKINFSLSYKYRETLGIERKKIESEIKEFFEEKFSNIFKNRIFKQNNISDNTVDLIEHIIKKSKEISNTDDIIRYCELAFKSERKIIDKLIEKIPKRKDNTCCKCIQKNSIKSLKNLRQYYKRKWEKFEKDGILSAVLIENAVNDLKRLKKIETEYKDNEEYIDIFRQPFDHDIPRYIHDSSNQKSLVNYLESNQQETKDVHKNSKNEKNHLCNYNTSINQIYNILNKTIEKEGFFSSIDTIITIDNIKELFKVLHSLDNDENKKFKEIFKKIFNMSINEKENNIAFFNEFLNCLDSGTGREDYITEERNNNCKNLLMSSYIPTNKQLEYLLNHLEFEDIISALFYRIINKDRGIIDYKEYCSWKNSIAHKRGGKSLKDSNYKNSLKSKIKNSSNNLCIYGKFIDWTLETAYNEFNDDYYEKFNEYNFKIPNYNINLSNYIILKSLLCNNTIIEFNVKNKDIKEEIEKELKKINFKIEVMFPFEFKKYDKNKVTIKQKRISKYRALLIKNKL